MRAAAGRHEDQVGGRRRHGEHIGERELTRLVHKERVDGADHVLPSEQPPGAGHDVDLAGFQG